MKEITIISRTIPAKPRSANYLISSPSSGGGGTVSVSPGGSVGVDIIKTGDSTAFSDSNVLSSLRANDEFINRKKDSSVTAVVDYLKGLKINGVPVTRILNKDTEEGEFSDTDIMSALRVIAEIAAHDEELKKMFLRKDQSDGTNFLLKFGEFIDSMVAGKGAGIFPNGRAQFERLEVRDSLTVLELIFNRLSAMESDYSFSESGTIESVSQLEDGTYSLKMKKRWDNDFTALAENDVVYGVVNDLASGGGKYYTSWLRVLHVDTSANTINAVMYPDSEVPGGKNYPPEPLMILSHRGNPIDTERQGYWYLSSREHCICMLNGVTKPILEESNYSVIVGRLKHLSLFDNLPINYLHSYIYVRGLVAQDIHRIDFQGVLPRIANDRGEWSMETAWVMNPAKYKS